MTGFFLCTSCFGIALKLHELSALNLFQYPIGILNRNGRGFLVCVSIMKREGNMASMPFLFDTWSGSLQWHRMIFFFLLYVVYFSFFIFVFFSSRTGSLRRGRRRSCCWTTSTPTSKITTSGHIATSSVSSSAW